MTSESDRHAGRSVSQSEPPAGAAAERVVVSYPADLSEWGRFQVEKPSFRAFLRKTRDAARPGDVWEEFVGVGCCGNTLDVPLRVERVDGGSRIDADTEIDYEVRDACGLEGSWRVQSKGGPSRA
ncbi:hypothetical protein [Natronorubrum aibiense]|uniref:DUF7968 domain-containing protein n=1 Tax=Natronorubrum aibiense TaxID=348826 RepID=A0A5P9P3T6_9EURY|nr:hypothetical protein [Natronorubrum aibiense]QFU82815.1 hypothetical protein GCU68_09900 [Natronorubrum aibiense]